MLEDAPLFNLKRVDTLVLQQSHNIKKDVLMHFWRPATLHDIYNKCAGWR